MQGASPLAFPALDRLRHLQSLPSRYLAGELAPGVVGSTSAAVVPRGGGLPSLSPAYPAFSFSSCPHPPDPLPGGKGETFSLFCRGLRPRHPCNRVGRGTGTTIGIRSFYRKSKGICLFYGQCRQPRRGGTGGEELRRLRWSSPPGQVEPVPPGFKPRGCKGRSPLHKITFSPPFPAGEERSASAGRGDRGQKESKRQGRQATRKARPPPGTPAAEARRPAAKNFPLPLDAQHKK